MREPLEVFERKLQTVVTQSLPKRSDVRPFVCEGSPMTCDVFLVGFNPATNGTAPFWSYWLSGYGFDKKRWLFDYKACRKPPKKLVSPTRERVDLVVAGLQPFKCLETNIYAVPSVKAKALPAIDRISDPFRFLIGTLKPTVILVHGKPASMLLQSLLRIPSLPKNRFTKINTHFGSVWIYTNRHLSRVKCSAASQLGVKTRQILIEARFRYRFRLRRFFLESKTRVLYSSPENRCYSGLNFGPRRQRRFARNR
jgi:hypothetical protein